MSVAKISVIVVSYNSGLYLKRCVDSVLGSDVPVQLIVVDNASADNSLEFIDALIEKYHSPNETLTSVTVIRNKENLGFSKAVNIGFAVSTGESIFLLNPDCVVFSRTARVLAETLQSDPDIGIVGALVFNEDGSEQRGCRRNEPTFRRSMMTSLKMAKRYEGIDLIYQPIPDSPLTVDAVSGAAMMVNRSHFESVGQMDEDFFLHCEDLDICRKMRDAGYRVIFSPDASVFHYQGASNVSSFFVERHKHRGMITYYRKHHAREQNKLTYWATMMMVTAHFVLTAAIAFLKRLLALFLPRKQAPISNQSHSGASLPPLVANDKPLVLISGANSDVGDYLLDRLATDDCQYLAVTRKTPGHYRQINRHGVCIHWLPLSFFQKVPTNDFGEISQWISIAPVWVTGSLIPSLERFRPQQIIAFSSTSIEGKKCSESDSDRKIVDRLKEGELVLSDFSRMHKIPTSLIRPTLVYGGPRNQNINFIRRFIRLFRFFPLVGKGEGLRQPVHADDLAWACLKIGQTYGFSKVDQDASSVKDLPGTEFEVYDLGGGETLTYRKMVLRVFNSEGIKPRIWEMSPTMVGLGIRALRLFPGFGFLSAGMATRMSANLTYSISKAKKHFSYEPRSFKP